MTAKPDPVAVTGPGTEPEVALEGFRRVDIRVGTILAAEPFPEARRPAFRLLIDFGPALGRRRSSAQITARYSCADLPGRQVAAVVNLPSKRIGPFLSEVLVLGFPDETGEIVLIAPERRVPDGGRLS